MTFNPFRIFSLFSGNHTQGETTMDVTTIHMNPAERKQHIERTRLGDACQDAQSKVDRAEGELNDSNSLINNWRTKKQGLLAELEILSAKDEDSLGYELKLRKLDLAKDAAELDDFIAGSLGRQESMKHSIEMASLGLTGARTKYNDFTQGVDAQLTASQMEEMKSIPKTSPMMTEERRANIISRAGMSFYTDEVPMV